MTKAESCSVSIKIALKWQRPYMKSIHNCDGPKRNTFCTWVFVTSESITSNTFQYSLTHSLVICFIFIPPSFLYQRFSDDFGGHGNEA